MAGNMFNSAKGIVQAHPKATVAILTVVGGFTAGFLVPRGRRAKL